jgi:anti-sigma regulatory factor (Ser/Thr protein kinase)
MRGSFKREIGSVSDVHGFVRAFFEREGLDRDYLFAVDLAVEEIFTNMVKYGDGGDREIEVELDMQDEHLTIRLIDHDVSPFDITAADVVDVDLPLKERKIGGLGIHLVRKFMDEIDYTYENRRSTVTLVKRFVTDHV